MPIHLLGTHERTGAAFQRDFYETMLHDLIDQARRAPGYGLRLFLIDGAIIDVCHFNAITDRYLTVAALPPDAEIPETHSVEAPPDHGHGSVCQEGLCDMTIDIIPFEVVYRVQLTSSKAKERRVGFHLGAAVARRAKNP